MKRSGRPLKRSGASKANPSTVRCFEFLILTATRSSEARLMTWGGSRPKKTDLDHSDRPNENGERASGAVVITGINAKKSWGYHHSALYSSYVPPLCVEPFQQGEPVMNKRPRASLLPTPSFAGLGLSAQEKNQLFLAFIPITSL